jgi:hypothetical protein
MKMHRLGQWAAIIWASIVRNFNRRSDEIFDFTLCLPAMLHM